MMRIKKKLLKENMTMTELARQLDVSRGGIYMVASGKYHMPTVDQKLKAWLKGERK